MDPVDHRLHVTFGAQVNETRFSLKDVLGKTNLVVGDTVCIDRDGKIWKKSPMCNGQKEKPANFDSGQRALVC